MRITGEQQHRDDTGRSGQQCRYCGAYDSLVWVHGHGQCVHCGINIEECCSGEQCEVRRDEA